MNIPRTRFALVLTALALSATLGGCTAASVAPSGGAPSPTVTSAPAGKVRAPDATGTIAAIHLSDGPISIGFTPDTGFERFAGTTFNVPPVAFPHGEDGVSLAASDLSVGERINVWVGDCRDTSPVDCDVQRVELAK